LIFLLLPGKAKFTNPDTGKPYAYGELFKQPQLADFLRNISTHGRDYFYKGSFAESFVETVLSHKGTITCKDMADYEVNRVVCQLNGVVYCVKVVAFQNS